MGKYSAEASTSKEALLQKAPTTATASSTSITDEGARQPQTSMNPLQGQREKQQTDAASASPPPRGDHTPTTVEEAAKALEDALVCAQFAAGCGAYATKFRGYKADVVFAEASVAIAIAMATAAYAAAGAAKAGSPMYYKQEWLTSSADAAVLAADAVYAALNARRTTMSLLLTPIVRLLPWPLRSPPPDSGLPHCSLKFLVANIITAAVTSAAAAQSAVEAAVTTNKTTTHIATGLQAPYDPEDAARLYVASRLAQASASAATAAASAVRATHPTLSTRAARAASTAIAAASNATTTRLKLLAALSQIKHPSLPDYYGEQMRKSLTMLESFRSKTAQLGFEDCLIDKVTYSEIPAAALLASFTSDSVKRKIQNGEMTVTTAGSACAPDISDQSSSVTVGGSTLGADEDMDNTNNDI